MRSSIRLAALLLVFPFLWLTIGCKSTIKTTQFTNQQFDFTYVEKVAVILFENLSSDRQSGDRATRIMITELLASGAVDVAEPGEVMAAITEITGTQARRTTTPSTEQIVALADRLQVQALMIGTVTQSETLRSGQILIPVVTLDVHMVEAETGATVWAATHTEKGGSFGAKVLGTGGEAISETTRRCVQEILKSLVE